MTTTHDDNGFGDLRWRPSDGPDLRCVSPRHCGNRRAVGSSCRWHHARDQHLADHRHRADPGCRLCPTVPDDAGRLLAPIHATRLDYLAGMVDGWYDHGTGLAPTPAALDAARTLLADAPFRLAPHLHLYPDTDGAIGVEDDHVCTDDWLSLDVGPDGAYTLYGPIGVGGDPIDDGLRFTVTADLWSYLATQLPHVWAATDD